MCFYMQVTVRIKVKVRIGENNCNIKNIYIKQFNTETSSKQFDKPCSNALYLYTTNTVPFAIKGNTMICKYEKIKFQKELT